MEEAGCVHNLGVVALLQLLLQQLEDPLHHVGVVPGEADQLGRVDGVVLEGGEDALNLKRVTKANMLDIKRKGVLT